MAAESAFLRMFGASPQPSPSNSDMTNTPPDKAATTTDASSPNMSFRKDAKEKSADSDSTTDDVCTCNGFIDFLNQTGHGFWCFGNGFAVGPSQPGKIVCSKYTTTAMVFTIEIGSREKVGGLGSLGSWIQHGLKQGTGGEV